VLTEAGHTLLPRARQVLALLEQSLQDLRDLSGEVKGSLRLLTSHHIGLHRLPRVLKTYKQRYPQVRLQIGFHNSQETHQRILAGEGDLGVTTLEASDAPLRHHDIWLDRLQLVVAPEHPLANQKSPSLKDLARFPAILPDARFTTGRIVRELFAQRGIPLLLDQDLGTEFLETIKALVSIGDSWSVLPQTMLDERFLIALPVRGIHLQRRLVCIHHRDRSLHRAARAFLEVLLEHRDPA
jgi:DNA-binding transcriptional LysR family regulator